MATSTIDANPGDTSILEDDHDPDLSLETSDDPVSLKNSNFWERFKILYFSGIGGHQGSCA